MATQPISIKNKSFDHENNEIIKPKSDPSSSSTSTERMSAITQSMIHLRRMTASSDGTNHNHNNLSPNHHHQTLEINTDMVLQASFSTTSKLITKVKRCLNCGYPIYCPRTKTDIGFCSKDCCTCFNWFNRSDSNDSTNIGANINNYPHNMHTNTTITNTSTNRITEHGDILDDIPSFSYRPTWMKSDNI